MHAWARTGSIPVKLQLKPLGLFYILWLVCSTAGIAEPNQTSEMAVANRGSAGAGWTGHDSHVPGCGPPIYRSHAFGAKGLWYAKNRPSVAEGVHTQLVQEKVS